jgi:hypothetical protein
VVKELDYAIKGDPLQNRREGDDARLFVVGGVQGVREWLRNVTYKKI